MSIDERMFYMENEIVFQKLTPKNDVEIKGYEDALNFIFKNDDVKNIAISGAYSSGKSSVLESYKHKHNEHSFLHISLTHFCSDKSEGQHKECQPNSVVNESVLEGKILNQLIHKIPPHKIPQTSFKVKRTIEIIDTIIYSILFCAFVFGSVLLVFMPSISKFVSELEDSWLKIVMEILFSPDMRIFGGFSCALCIIAFAYKSIKEQKYRNMFRKISLQGNEIEIMESNEDSYFDKYLNEVLYLFENVDIDVIVFEDMDRFDSGIIFERLREINILVNSNRKTKPLRFFYLIRDDIFTSKDRTKFFDYIIPVIPVIDNSNSYEQLTKILENNCVLDQLDKGFLQGLSLYIDDMRILKNICNEFALYIKRLDTTELNYNKMLAMITYKNLFPHDFSKLQLDSGFVYEVFSKKLYLISETLKKLRDEKQEIINRITLIKNENLVSLEEIDDAYKAKYNRLPKKNVYGYSSSNILTEEGETKKKQYDKELQLRKQAVQDKLDNKLPEFEEEQARIEHEIALLQSRTLSELITRENINDLFSISSQNELGEKNEFKEIKRSSYFDLLKFLIRNGYIDETYKDYMSYFYPGSMSTNDKTFLRRITDKRGSDYPYSINEPEKIINSPVLGISDFEQEEVLNFDLFKYLLVQGKSGKEAKYLRTFISQLREKKNFEFLSKYYEIDKSNGRFVIVLNEQWPRFFSSALQSGKISSDQIRQFSIDTLLFSDIDKIKIVNKNNCLTEYISQCPDYLNIEQPNIDKLISGFEHIEVCFEKINYDISNKNLFNEIYSNNLYVLNFENIKLMLKTQYLIENDSDIIHKNYTLVQSRDDSPLALYIDEYIMEYFDLVVKNCEGEISDDEDIVIEVLNNQNIDNVMKESYIKYLIIEISDITKIADGDFWSFAIEQEKICFSSDNFVNYFIKFSIDNTLINFINGTSTEIDFTHIAKKFGERTAQQLFESIAKCAEIDTPKYQKVLTDLNFIYTNFNIDNISTDKIEVLITSKKLKMNAHNLEFIRGNYPENRYSFIKHNLDKYLEIQNDVFSFEEALNIIELDIDDTAKISLLSFTNKAISIIDKDYTDTVMAYIITNNFEQSDISALLENYSQYQEKTKNAISDLAIKNVKNIISQKLIVDNNLLSILLSSNDISSNQKIDLFDLAIPNMNQNECITHLDDLGYGEIKSVFSRNASRRKYDKNKETAAIFDVFKSHNLIADYHEDEKNPSKYMVVKNRG